MTLFLSSSAGASGPTVAGGTEHARAPLPIEEVPMAKDRERSADVPTITTEASLATLGPDWDTEDAYWQSAYPERPYARADRGFDYYRAAYRFGAERATLWRHREWTDAERSLHEAWMATADAVNAAWDEMKEAIRDAWDHVRGRLPDDRTHIR